MHFGEHTLTDADLVKSKHMNITSNRASNSGKNVASLKNDDEHVEVIQKVPVSENKMTTLDLPNSIRDVNGKDSNVEAINHLDFKDKALNNAETTTRKTSSTSDLGVSVNETDMIINVTTENIEPGNEL